jgi:hypothetical protein
MRYYNEIFVLTCASVASFYVDKHRGCEDLKLFTHHVFNIILHFGWLTNDPVLLKLYLFAPLVTMIHWVVNDNRCTVTEQYNIACNLPKETPFNDIINIVGLKRYGWWNNLGHYIYLTLVFFTAVLKLTTA